MKQDSSFERSPPRKVLSQTYLAARPVRRAASLPEVQEGGRVRHRSGQRFPGHPGYPSIHRHRRGSAYGVSPLGGVRRPSRHRRGVLPQIIFQVRAHNYTLLSQIYEAVEFDNTSSDGMFYSDECSEDWDFLTQHDIAAAMQGITSQIQPALQSDLQLEYDACRLWHVQQSPSAQKQPVVSDIPTLVLSDEYDPITPPAYGKLTAQTLKNSYYFLFPGLGHGAEYNSACVDSIISAFDDHPTQKPSDACVAGMGEPHFV